MKIPGITKASQKPRTSKQRTGNKAEDEALALLKKAGLKLIERNYRCRTGEIDLIMQEAQTLVFVEVRYRANSLYGGPLETVTASKQNKIRSAAQHYMVEKNLSANYSLRFDVVGMSNSETNWIKGAFY